MARALRIGRLAIPIPALILLTASVAMALTVYAETWMYLYVKPRPMPVYITPTYVSMTVYEASASEQLITIENSYGNMTFEIGYDISATYRDVYGSIRDLVPYVHVIFLDYSRTPLPDADNDLRPEIYSPRDVPVKFYVQVIIDKVPDLAEGSVSLHVFLTEYVQGA
jgi:hypothetical protein